MEDLPAVIVSSPTPSNTSQATQSTVIKTSAGNPTAFIDYETQQAIYKQIAAKASPSGQTPAVPMSEQLARYCLKISTAIHILFFSFLD